MTDESKSTDDRLHHHDVWEVVPDPPRACAQDWRQTGTCETSQVDGVPCERPDGDCECCDHSKLTP